MFRRFQVLGGAVVLCSLAMLDSASGQTSNAAPECTPDSAVIAAERRSVGSRWLFDGARWHCGLGHGVSYEVVMRLAPPDDERDYPNIRSLEVRRATAQGLAAQRLAVTQWSLVFQSTDIEAADLDGDGWNDLIMRFQMIRGTNMSNHVWRYRSGSGAFAADSTLSRLMNVNPAGKGCISTSELTGPGPDDVATSRYCFRHGAWVEEKTEVPRHR